MAFLKSITMYLKLARTSLYKEVLFEPLLTSCANAIQERTSMYKSFQVSILRFLEYKQLLLINNKVVYFFNFLGMANFRIMPFQILKFFTRALQWGITCVWIHFVRCLKKENVRTKNLEMPKLVLVSVNTLWKYIVYLLDTKLSVLHHN